MKIGGVEATPPIPPRPASRPTTVASLHPPPARRRPPPQTPRPPARGPPPPGPPGPLPGADRLAEQHRRQRHPHQRSDVQEDRRAARSHALDRRVPPEVRDGAEDRVVDEHDPCDR